MNEETVKSKGKLYIVSTPIGNKDDITLRAINTIKRCDIVVCEEMKMGALTLRNLNLAKEMIPLNENNETEMTMDVLNLLKQGKQIALISDAGTPIFADPGLYLLKSAVSNNIDIEVVPGVSSIMTAIVRSGFEIYEFLYAGFLPRKNEDRDRRILKLARERRTTVVMETPYRLNTILEAFTNVIPNRKVYIGMNLTMPFETHHYGTFEELFKKFENSKLKSEFVIVMEGNKEWLELKNKVENDDDFDEDDDEPVVYEYPVKAHQKQIERPKKVISPRQRSSEYSDDRPKPRNSNFSRTKPNSGRSDFSSRKPKSDGSDFSEKPRFGKSDSKFSKPKSRFGSNKFEKSDFGDRPAFKKNTTSERVIGKFSERDIEARKNDKTDSFDKRHSFGNKPKSNSKFRGKSNERNRGRR